MKKGVLYTFGASIILIICFIAFVLPSSLSRVADQQEGLVFGKYNGKKIEKMTIENKKMVDEIVSNIKTPVVGIVSQIDKKKTQRHAAAPFTTSTLQQEAARKLYFSSTPQFAVTLQYSMGLKPSISFSRSTTNFTATD